MLNSINMLSNSLPKRTTTQFIKDKKRIIFRSYRLDITCKERILIGSIITLSKLRTKGLISSSFWAPLAFKRFPVQFSINPCLILLMICIQCAHIIYDPCNSSHRPSFAIIFPFYILHENNEKRGQKSKM